MDITKDQSQSHLAYPKQEKPGSKHRPSIELYGPSYQLYFTGWPFWAILTAKHKKNIKQQFSSVKGVITVR